MIGVRRPGCKSVRFSMSGPSSPRPSGCTSSPAGDGSGAWCSRSGRLVGRAACTKALRSDPSLTPLQRLGRSIGRDGKGVGSWSVRSRLSSPSRCSRTSSPLEYSGSRSTPPSALRPPGRSRGWPPVRGTSRDGDGWDPRSRRHLGRRRRPPFARPADGSSGRDPALRVPSTTGPAPSRRAPWGVGACGRRPTRRTSHRPRRGWTAWATCGGTVSCGPPPCRRSRRSPSPSPSPPSSAPSSARGRRVPHGRPGAGADARVRPRHAAGRRGPRRHPPQATTQG
jgi:hypothetical protein